MRRRRYFILEMVLGAIAAAVAALEALDIYTDYRVDRLLRRKWVPGRGPRLSDCWAYARSQGRRA